MNGIYLIIGGNRGNRVKAIEESKNALTKQVGNIIVSSAIYETSAWGNTQQPDFLNQVLYIETSKTADEVLNICLRIEQDMGRIRSIKWEARIIDIDILFFNDEIINLDNLKIPHPHLHKRRFVLVPLQEIAPDFVHPMLKLTIGCLLTICTDTLNVRKYISD